MLFIKRYALIFCFLLIAQQSIEARQKMICLYWNPADDVYEKEFVDVRGLKDARILLPAVIDGRSNKETIGKNIERSKPRYFMTENDLAQWATDRTRFILDYFKVNLVDESPDIILQFELVNFFVTEESVYQGDIAFAVTAKSVGGESIWHGTINGESNRWGRSYKKDNYMECMCNAFVDAVYALLKNDEFLTTIANHIHE